LLFSVVFEVESEHDDPCHNTECSADSVVDYVIHSCGDVGLNIEGEETRQRLYKEEDRKRSMRVVELKPTHAPNVVIDARVLDAPQEAERACEYEAEFVDPSIGDEGHHGSYYLN
jgi:hypothetical protein